MHNAEINVDFVVKLNAKLERLKKVPVVWKIRINEVAITVKSNFLVQIDRSPSLDLVQANERKVFRRQR